MTYIQYNRWNKYGAKKQVYGDRKYHSGAEADYAQELDLRKNGGDIADWEPQVKLPLKVNGTTLGNYYIDFVITHNDGSKEYVEIKGAETMMWRWKWKHFEAVFDTDFREHPDDKITIVKVRSNWGRKKR